MSNKWDSVSLSRRLNRFIWPTFYNTALPPPAHFINSSRHLLILYNVYSWNTDMAPMTVCLIKHWLAEADNDIAWKTSQTGWNMSIFAKFSLDEEVVHPAKRTISYISHVFQYKYSMEMLRSCYWEGNSVYCQFQIRRHRLPTVCRGSHHASINTKITIYIMLIAFKNWCWWQHKDWKDVK